MYINQLIMVLSMTVSRYHLFSIHSDHMFLFELCMLQKTRVSNAMGSKQQTTHDDDVIMASGVYVGIFWLVLHGP